MRADPHLFKDDVNIPAKLEAADSHANKLFSCSQVDIRFSRTLNSCKLPQIRYATPERLLQRLTDLRFLSIDFLNTFLLTYRVFTGEDLSRKSIWMVTCGLRAEVHSFASSYSSFSSSLTKNSSPTLQLLQPSEYIVFNNQRSNTAERTFILPQTVKQF